jgi:hypothetical protein
LSVGAQKNITLYRKYASLRHLRHHDIAEEEVKMTELTLSRVDKFLAAVASSPAARGNLVFALDATASRERTWDTACQLQAQMFQEVANIGSLSMQLAYFRGPHGVGGECKASRWIDNPADLAAAMSKIRCHAGYTQIGNILDHVSRETLHRKINAMVFVGDACEEKHTTLIEAASRLAKLNVPVFLFQEGRDPDAQRLFEEIARMTRGAYHRFDQGAAQQLRELLRAVAAFSVGGTTALERQSSAAAKYMLQQIKSR